MASGAPPRRPALGRSTVPLLTILSFGRFDFGVAIRGATSAERHGIGRRLQVLTAGFDVNDKGVVADDNQVGPSGQRGRLATQSDIVLSFGIHLVAVFFLFGLFLSQQRCVLHEPIGLVEDGRDLVPFLKMGFEPNGPFAGIVAGQQLGQPGGPDVGRFARDRQGGTRSIGFATSLWTASAASQWPAVINLRHRRLGGGPVVGDGPTVGSASGWVAVALGCRCAALASGFPGSGWSPAFRSGLGNRDWMPCISVGNGHRSRSASIG